MSEFRKPSLAETVTPLMNKAWFLENQALCDSKTGSSITAAFLRERAEGLRSEDRHNKIEVLFERSDAQNAVIDKGLQRIKPKAYTTAFTGQRDFGDEAHELKK